MKKNTLILTALVLILGGLVYYFQVLKDDTNSLTDGKDWQRSFAIEEPSIIETIFISKLNGLQIKLTRDGQAWKVNDKYMVNPNVMKTLMNAVTEIELQRTPIAKESKNIVKNLAANGTNVKYFDKAGNVVKAYFLGGADLEGTGTEILMEGSKQPYIVNVPYFQGVLSVRFNRPEIEWRDRAVFRLDPNNIESVSIEYPKQKSKSFRLSKEGGDFFVEQYFDLTGKDKKKVNSNKADQYLQEFDLKIAEAIENDYTGRDSILATVPFCKMELKMNNQEFKRVSFYDIKSRYASGKLKSEAAERFLCMIEPQDDFVMVQLGVFKDILRPYDYF